MTNRGRCGTARRPCPPGTWRRGQVHAYDLDGRPDRPDLGDRNRPGRAPGRLARGAQRRRVRRAGRAGLQEPVRRGHAAPHTEPEPELRHPVREGAAGRPRHPAEQEGSRALGRPAVTARAHPGAGQATAAAHPGRAAGRARPHRPAGLPGRGDDRDDRRRRLGAALLAPGRRARAGRRLPHRAVARPAPGGRRGRRPAGRSPAADRPDRRGRRVRRPADRGADPARRGADPPARQNQRDGRAGTARLGIPPGQPGGGRDGLSTQPGRQRTRATDPRAATAADGGKPMSVLTMPAQPDQDTAPRPVPWRRMAWITWRQQRATLIAVPAVLAAVAVFLVIFGLKAHHDYAALVNCPLNQGQQSNACAELFRTFNSTDWPLANACSILIGLAPVLIGAFAGAPLLARELETGTYRFAWTQGLVRERQAVAKHAQLGATVVRLAGALGVLFSWFFQPFLYAQEMSRLTETVFDTSGIVFPAFALISFAIGAFLGMLFRRVVPALAATLGVYLAVRL